jgi:hypothetical protein
LGTLVVGAAKGKVELPGYRAPERGYFLGEGISKEVAVQMDYFRRLTITAEVLAEGARRASDPFAAAGYAASLRAIQGAFSGIGPRFSKVLSRALDVSLATLKAQRASETDPGRQIRLDTRLQEQEALLGQRAEILTEISKIEAAIQSAVNSVAPITQVAIAEAVRQQTLQPGAPWVNPLASTTAGLEETDLAGLRRERFLLPEAVSQRAGVGVIAVGLEEPEVLALGVALSQIKTSTGSVPVAFVVKDPADKAGLEELGVSASQVFLVGAPETPTQESALEAARFWLKEVWGMKVVELIDRVDQTIQLILRNLFGIELGGEQARVWQGFIERVTGALAAAA